MSVIIITTANYYYWLYSRLSLFLESARDQGAVRAAAAAGRHRAPGEGRRAAFRRGPRGGAPCIVTYNLK